jgi:hypothetical protein
MKTLTILTLLFLSAFQSYSQSIEVKKVWIKGENGGRIEKIIFDNDKNIIASWSNKNEINLYTTKFTPSLDILWEQDISFQFDRKGDRFNSINDLAIFSNGNILSVGTTMKGDFVNGFPAYDWDIYTMNIYGKKVWRRFLGNWGFDTPYAVKINQKDEVIVCGIADFDIGQSEASSGYIVKLNNKGEILWEKIIQFHENDFSYCSDLILLNSNIFAIGASQSEKKPNLTLLKISDNGEVKKIIEYSDKKLFDNEISTSGIKLKIDDDNKLLVSIGSRCGKGDLWNCEKGFFIKVDTSGKVIQSYKIDKGSLIDFVTTSNGYYLLTRTQKKNMLIKIDKNFKLKETINLEDISGYKLDLTSIIIDEKNIYIGGGEVKTLSNPKSIIIQLKR